jgi:hypothetical protein
VLVAQIPVNQPRVDVGTPTGYQVADSNIATKLIALKK